VSSGRSGFVSKEHAGQRQPVLLLGPDRACRRLAGALLLIRYRGIAATDGASALRAIAASGADVVGGMLSADLVEPIAVLRELHASLAAPLLWTLWGVRPDAGRAAELRRQNVRFVLAEPFTEEDLRFVLDAGYQLGAFESMRKAPRVPTSLRARVVTKTGERVAIVCNLSIGGVYLATPRPALRGGQIDFEIPLPDLPLRTTAEVLWNNVPGNLRRPGAPVGMGVRFSDLPAPTLAALQRFLEARAASYRL
jgi:hypothetical protein